MRFMSVFCPIFAYHDNFILKKTILVYLGDAVKSHDIQLSRGKEMKYVHPTYHNLPAFLFGIWPFHSREE